MSALLPCPHCGSEPWFKGDAGQWQDDNRYVEMSVECCATLTETIGWRKARDMTKVQREAELKTRLTAAWNKREVPEDAPAAPARAATVMPLIGPLLDAWACCSQACREELPELDKQLRRINRAMEDAGEGPNADWASPPAA